MFQYRVTPLIVRGMSPTELLMGRKLRDKVPKVKEQLRGRYTRLKFRQKEYADRTEEELNTVTLDRETKY